MTTETDNALGDTYRIAHSRDLESVEYQVNLFWKCGFQICGPLWQAQNGTYIQVMTRDT